VVWPSGVRVAFDSPGFFFFQAEDGIRDFHVTGVQTCALPILFVRAGHRRSGISRELAAAAVAFARERGARAVEAYPITTTAVIRSEERRVGKECGSRWSPYQGEEKDVNTNCVASPRARASARR